MTPRQIELARHALGLRDTNSVAYRNYFSAEPGHVDYPDWESMVADGFAVKRQYKLIPGSVFHMTLNGARLALRDGEGLRNANYPQAGDV